MRFLLAIVLAGSVPVGAAGDGFSEPGASAPVPSHCISTCGEFFSQCIGQCEAIDYGGNRASAMACIETGCPTIYRSCIQACLKDWDWEF